MVLRKERPPSVGDHQIMSNEQPVTKRQRIDNRNNNEAATTASATTTTIEPKDDQENPPDILVGPSTSSSSSSAAAVIQLTTTATTITTTAISTGVIINESILKNGNGSTDEVDKSIVVNKEFPDLLRTNNCNNGNEMAEFEEYLIKQCLCGISERTLRRPFQSHYNHDVNGVKRIANLSEWPTNKLLQFLSNLQLLFDIYLKQNSKGFLCSRIMDVCEALIRNDHNLIDEIIELGNFNNKYVQFLSGRVLASFLVIAKNNMDENWLKKLVNNLFGFERLDNAAVRKIHFSLEVIKRIVEWKDVDVHPLEDEDLHHNGGGVVVSQPTLENNYFAVHFNSEMVSVSGSGEGGSAGSSNCTTLNGKGDLFGNSSSSSNSSGTSNSNGTSINCSSSSTSNNNSDRNNFNNSYKQKSTIENNENDCHIITLTDSESFDTTHLKCITIKELENKWPGLVKNMSSLISTHRNVNDAENCILSFLLLWENIISVKANLPIVETMPFYAQLDKFELLLNQHLSCTVYKQMLCLFNEALCYGSTLALQDLLPEQTCILAHQIVRHVKDFRILDSLPRRHPENNIGFLGYKGPTITYEDGTLNRIVLNEVNGHSSSSSEIPDMDKSILQKMVLLVLKSVAVTVKEIRCDSSDSSIDSSDYDAFQDMVLIERSIRDVLRKLESFIKNTLEFHPECHFSKILIHLFDDQDDHLIEAMVCTLDVTAGISFRNNAFPDLVSMLNPVYTFLEFLKMISNSSDLLLDLLVSNETCFLLYLLRFLKYIRLNWSMFVSSCGEFGMGLNILDDAMSVLIRLRLQISRLVSKSLYPYDISPVLRLLESCESLYEGNELS